MNIRTTFTKNTVYVSTKYKCDCGHKFVRKSSDWFTINPFNTKTSDECKKEIKEKLSNQKRNCPKCNSICTPL